jgi:hypothetical protein
VIRQPRIRRRLALTSPRHAATLTAPPDVKFTVLALDHASAAAKDLENARLAAALHRLATAAETLAAAIDYWCADWLIRWQ